MGRGAYRGKAKRQADKGPKVTIITDYDDRRRDFAIDRTKARQLFREGKLRWDAIEKAYCLTGTKRQREKTRNDIC
jgi:hypothetical protein